MKDFPKTLIDRAAVFLNRHAIESILLVFWVLFFQAGPSPLLQSSFAQPPQVSLKSVRTIRIGIPSRFDRKQFVSTPYYQSLLKQIKETLGQKENPNAQDYEVEIAIGNEYQILDWLERGDLDGAVLPPLLGYLVKWQRKISSLKGVRKFFTDIAPIHGTPEAGIPPYGLRIRAFACSDGEPPHKNQGRTGCTAGTRRFRRRTSR